MGTVLSGFLKKKKTMSQKKEMLYEGKAKQVLQLKILQKL